MLFVITDRQQFNPLYACSEKDIFLCGIVSNYNYLSSSVVSFKSLRLLDSRSFSS